MILVKKICLWFYDFTIRVYIVCSVSCWKSVFDNLGVGQFFNMSWVTEYSWDDKILHETKSESKPKLEQKNYDNNKISFLYVQILRDLSNLKD